MADFERRQLEIELEFVRWSFDERNNFSEGSSKSKKDVQVIRVRGVAAPRVFELELLVKLELLVISNSKSFFNRLNLASEPFSSYT